MLKEIWKICSTKNTLDGKKVEYRCSAGTYRIKKCPARLYFPSNNFNFKEVEKTFIKPNL